MAGFIHISSGTGLSISTLSFNRIVEYTRKLLVNDNCCLQKIYEPLDEGGFNMISLEEQDKSGFHTFYNATKLAFLEYEKGLDRFKKEDSRYESTYQSWDELLKMLKQDNRF